MSSVEKDPFLSTLIQHNWTKGDMVRSSSQAHSTTCSLSAQSQVRGTCSTCVTSVVSPGHLMLEKNEFLDFSHPEFLDVELCSVLIKISFIPLL